MMPAANDVNKVYLSQLLGGFARLAATDDRIINGITINSAAVQSGDAFFALQGTRVHGLQYASQAIEYGAVAVIAEAGPQANQQLKDELLQQALKNSGACLVLVESLSQQLGLIADRFFGQPSSQLDMVGITGTNGKTSCSQFVARALNEDAPSAVIGTIGTGLVSNLVDATHTTPDAISVHNMLRDYVDQGASSAVMEVSSHGLEQGRVNGVAFDVVVFTNLSHDHLDYHGDMQSYAAAKRKLFSMPGISTAVVNADDDYGKRLIQDFTGSYEVLDYSVDAGNVKTKIGLTGMLQDKNGMTLSVRTPSGSGKIQTELLGRFNASNLLASLGVLLALGMPLDKALKRLSRSENVPGRMERVDIDAAHPLVVVDYAHTPDALQKALSALREHGDFSGTAKLWCVFGCGGDRDQDKRKTMGSVAEQNADTVVLTDDNPRTEDSQAIINAILSGVSNQQNVISINDRVSAIEYAITHAGAQDVILVAGKGHEAYQVFGKEKRHYDGDVEVIRQFLNRHFQHNEE